MIRLIDVDGNSYNVELKIVHDKLYVIWDGEQSLVDITKVDIDIWERE